MALAQEKPVEFLRDYKEVKRPVLTKVLVTSAEFTDVLDTIEKYVGHLRPMRKKQDELNEALNIIKEMKFVGLLSYEFRQKTYYELQDLLDDMYYEVHS